MNAGVDELYLHIPFCARRCLYCDFPTSAISPDDPLMDRYIDRLGLSVRRAARTGLLEDLDTVYIGGGTPSYLGSARLERLIEMLNLFVNVDTSVEFSLEANPGSLDMRLARDLRALGVTRFSLGVQSLDDSVLSTLGRIHDAHTAADLMCQLSDGGFEYSIDLICGVPGQSMGSWTHTLTQALGLGVQHVSVYPLTVEEGTPLQRAILDGSMDAPDEDLQTDMMLVARDILGQADLRRYETSNYACPGHESRHNLGYWTGATYLGLGRGASSYLLPDQFDAAVASGLLSPDMSSAEGAVTVRCDCVCSTDAYTEAQSQPVHIESLDAAHSVHEQTMLRMRLARGLSDAELDYAASIVSDMPDRLRHLEELGLIQHEEGFWTPTERGWLMGNSIARELA